MTTYNDFSIVNVFPDFTNKSLIIETNFKVDPTSVDSNTVKFYDYDNSKLYIYTLKCDNKRIIIQMIDAPVCGLRYFLHIVGIKDALGRILKTQYNDYIIFNYDIRTKITVMSPVSRTTYNSKIIDIKLKAAEIEEGIRYKIEISPDASFFKKLADIQCNEANIKLDSTEDSISINNSSIEGDVVKVSVTIEKDGQLFIRARAELSDDTVGDWSEITSFNIHTVPMDSIETTFLEEYLTSYDLFDEESLIETKIEDRTVIGTNEGMLYIEFNKNIKLPNNYTLNEDGYISLGTVIGTRKELK